MSTRKTARLSEVDDAQTVEVVTKLRRTLMSMERTLLRMAKKARSMAADLEKVEGVRS